MTTVTRTIVVLAIALVTSLTGAMAQDASNSYGTFSSSGTGIVIPARSWDISAEVDNKISKLSSARTAGTCRGCMMAFP